MKPLIKVTLEHRTVYLKKCSGLSSTIVLGLTLFRSRRLIASVTNLNKQIFNPTILVNIKNMLGDLRDYNYTFNIQYPTPFGKESLYSCFNSSRRLNNLPSTMK